MALQCTFKVLVSKLWTVFYETFNQQKSKNSYNINGRQTKLATYNCLHTYRFLPESCSKDYHMKKSKNIDYLQWKYFWDWLAIVSSSISSVKSIHQESSIFSSSFTPLLNRQTFPEEGHGLKRLFHNGRQKTTILIGLFLMTSCFWWRHQIPPPSR